MPASAGLYTGPVRGEIRILGEGSCVSIGRGQGRKGAREWTVAVALVVPYSVNEIFAGIRDDGAGLLFRSLGWRAIVYSLVL